MSLKPKTHGGVAQRHVYRDLFVASARLVRTAKSFKSANLYQHPATHILKDNKAETVCGYTDFVVVGGTKDETHFCGRCRVKYIKESNG